MSDHLQRALRWPLWSWRNLSITAVGVLLILGLVGKAGALIGHTNRTNHPTVVSSPSHITVTPAEPTTRTTPPIGVAAPSSSTTASTVSTASCEQTASDFVRAWAKPTMSSGEWLEGIKPYAVPALVDKLSSTDPARVPASAVLGVARIMGSTGSSVTAQILTDAGRVEVTLERGQESCAVTGLQAVTDVPGASTPRLSSGSEATGS